MQRVRRLYSLLIPLHDSALSTSNNTFASIGGFGLASAVATNIRLYTPHELEQRNQVTRKYTCIAVMLIGTVIGKILLIHNVLGSWIL